jgi:hypothetical protein
MDTKFFTLLEKHGFAAVVALILLFFVGRVVVARLDAIDERLSEFATHGRILQQICVNTANTEGERVACEVGRR